MTLQNFKTKFWWLKEGDFFFFFWTMLITQPHLEMKYVMGNQDAPTIHHYGIYILKAEYKDRLHRKWVSRSGCSGEWEQDMWWSQ